MTRLMIANPEDGCRLETELYDRRVCYAHHLQSQPHDCVDGNGIDERTRQSRSGNVQDECKAQGIAVVLSHPYGPLGGRMDNNVVEALWEALCGFTNAQELDSEEVAVAEENAPTERQRQSQNETFDSTTCQTRPLVVVRYNARCTPNSYSICHVQSLTYQLICIDAMMLL